MNAHDEDAPMKQEDRIAWPEAPQPPGAGERVRRVARSAFLDAHAPRSVQLAGRAGRSGVDVAVVLAAALYLYWAFETAIAINH